VATNRVDVHQHLVPPEYRAWLTEHDQPPGPEWSARTTIETMDEQGVATALLSIATPGAHLGDDGEARRIARLVNEFAAEVVKDRPDRFGFFATLTLPDVDGAVAEAGYALDTLGADGVVLLANTRGEYLGAKAFEPLMAELDRRGAVVFVHPSDLPGPGVPGIPPVTADYLHDTTRAAINLVHTSTVARYPGLKLILAHGGGYVPYTAYRLAAALSLTADRSMDDLLADFGRFYFETGLSTSPVSLPSLLAFAQPERVVYGSDWPYAPDGIVRYFADHLDRLAGAGRLAAINHENAYRLFPRLLNFADR
jgi:6-methylsalicylate decarboxylase